MNCLLNHLIFLDLFAKERTIKKHIFWPFALESLTKHSKALLLYLFEYLSNMLD